MDHYTAIVSIMFLAFFEVIAICYSYGKNHHLALGGLILGSNCKAVFCVCTQIYLQFVIIIFVISMCVC